MATYIFPQVTVQQVFARNVSTAARRMHATIVGPHAFLRRYDIEDERVRVTLGFYDRVADQAHNWPDLPVGGLIDTDYTKVFVRDALLHYFGDDRAAGSSITKTSGYNNRIRSATVNFASNGFSVTDPDADPTWPRAADLLDRDVKPGDTVRVDYVDTDSESGSLWTYVKKLYGDPQAAVVAAPEYDAGNQATQGLSTTVTQIAGPRNCVTWTANGASYDGRPSGRVSETYRVVVLESSVGGDFTKAKIRVISGDGLDNVASMRPEAAGDPTAIGARGLLVTLDKADNTCSASASDDNVNPDDLIAGQEFRIVVNQAFTATTAIVSGTYDSENNTTYVVTVTRGGAYAGTVKPQITVTTTTASDISGPTDVINPSSPVALGAAGLAIEFNSTALCKGDKIYVQVTGIVEGPMRTIELGHNLPSNVAAGSQVGLDLFIRVPKLDVTKNRIGFSPEVNWAQTEDEITIKSGMVAYESSWTDDGVQEPLDVWSDEDQDFGEVYVEYRAWLPDLAVSLETLNADDDINTAIPGAAHPDNPLKFAVLKARATSGGVPIKYIAVADPTSAESWTDAAEILIGNDDVYGIVPLTRDKDVLDVFKAHVEAMSSETQCLWRVLWTNLAGVPTIPVVSAGSSIPNHTTATTTDGEVCLAVIESDPESTDAVEYTIVRCASGNGQFITNGVRAGDIVRALYTSDGFGAYTYSTFVVDEVQSENQLRLAVGPSGPASVASKIEVWRNLKATEEAQEIATFAGSWGSRRVRAVWPDRYENGTAVEEGYFLCAALAGLVSGVLPQQGVTNVEFSGATAVTRTTKKFNKTQLDTLAGAGTWIVTQDRRTGQIFSRQAVTTGDTEILEQREEMVCRNVDNISYRFYDTMAPFIGRTNAVRRMVDRLERITLDLIATLQTESNTPDLGGQLVSAEPTRIEISTTNRAAIEIDIDCQVPGPLNNIPIRLVINPDG